MTNGQVRLGFIGAGGIVQRALAPAAHAASGVTVQAVAARSLERAASVGASVGAERAYDDYAALLADDSIDLVYVALDNGGHLPWTLAALAAGKHVLCEKPLGLTPAAAQEMRTAADQAGKLLVEAFWYRWHPRTRRLSQLLAEGALGPIRRIDAGFTFHGPGEGDPEQQYRLNPGRGGGGIYDVGCYALSAVHLGCGSLDVVDAEARYGATGVDLEASAHLRTADGTDAFVRCGINGADRQEIAVTGAAARLEFGAPAFTALHVPVGLTITTPDRAVRTEEFAPVDPYQLMIEAVGARVRGEDSFLPGPEHSTLVAESTAALFEALRSEP